MQYTYTQPGATKSSRPFHDRLSALKPFQDRRTDILTYRGAICNQKGCPMVHWIIVKLYAKTYVPSLRDEKVKRLSLFQNRQTDIVAYRGAKFSQKGCPMVHWIM